MQIAVFFIMLALCMAGVIFTAFDKKKKLAKVKSIKEIKDIIPE